MLKRFEVQRCELGGHHFFRESCVERCERFVGPGTLGQKGQQVARKSSEAVGLHSPQCVQEFVTEHEAELGDLLFAVVNLCRKAGTHPSLALDKANAKFQARFEAIEKLAAERGIDVKTAGLEALDKLWDEVKAGE